MTDDAFFSLMGGVRLDRKRFSRDIESFERHSHIQYDDVVSDDVHGTSSCLDFFGCNSSNVVDTQQQQQQPAAKKRKKTLTDPLSMSSAPSGSFGNAKVTTTGTDIPASIKSFDDLNSTRDVPTWLVRNASSMGYTTPTPIQSHAWPVLLSRREIMGVAPTGSGKTTAFLLPLVAGLSISTDVDDDDDDGDDKKKKKRTKKKKNKNRQTPKAIIVSPTRELSQQIHREVERLTKNNSLKSCVLSKSVSLAQIKGTDILVTTPMRLVSLIQRKDVSLSNVEFLVLDEADRLLDMGFVEQMDEIIAACDLPSCVRALFSATMPSSVEDLARSFLRDPVRVTVGERHAATDTIQQRLLFVGKEEGKIMALRQLIKAGVRPPVLVFVQSKERAQQLFRELVYDGINVDVIHAERTRAQRDQVVQNFRLGRTWVLICTELMARGVDFKGVNLVINYDFPQTAVSYIHRVGRTGRAGRDGEAVTLFTEQDGVYLRSIANVIRASGCEVPDWMLSLKAPSKNMKRDLAKRPLKRRNVGIRGGKETGIENTSRRRHVHNSKLRIEAAKLREEGNSNEYESTD